MYLCPSLIPPPNTTHHPSVPNIPKNTYIHQKCLTLLLTSMLLLAILSYKHFLSSLWLYLVKINLINTEMFLPFVFSQLLLIISTREYTIVIFCWHSFSISRVYLSPEQNSCLIHHWNIVPGTYETFSKHVDYWKYKNDNIHTVNVTLLSGGSKRVIWKWPWNLWVMGNKFD